MTEILILTTADSPELAKKIALALVEAGHAACVNILPGIRSIYRWQGRVCDENELMLVIKSAADRFETVRAAIRRLHSYQVPEIISLPITCGDADYLQWLHAQLSCALSNEENG